MGKRTAPRGQTGPVIVTGTELAAVVDRLVAAGCVAAAEEADELVAGAPDAATLDQWVRRRELGEPPGWITGGVVFCDRPLQLVPGVYVPRRQTEALARLAAARLPDHGRAVDLCTGAGAVAADMMHEVPTATVFGLDVDPIAAACARRNGVVSGAADLDAPLHARGTFDVVTAVAPYVPTGELSLLPTDVQRYEPRRARSMAARTDSTWSEGWSKPRPGCCGRAAGCSPKSAASRTERSGRPSTTTASPSSNRGRTPTETSGASRPGRPTGRDRLGHGRLSGGSLRRWLRRHDRLAHRSRLERPVEDLSHVFGQVERHLLPHGLGDVLEVRPVALRQDDRRSGRPVAPRAPSA